MKSSIILAVSAAAIVLAGGLAETARAGVGVGVQLGSMNYSGQVLPGSPDLSGDLSYGVHLNVSPIPVFDVSLRAEYFKTEFAYAVAIAPGSTLNTSMEYQDFSMYLNARYKFFSGPGVPLSLYGAGGLGWHLINTEILSALGGSIGSLSINNLQSELRLGWNAILGAEFSTIGFPFSVFVEGRYQSVNLDADNLSGSGVYGGMTLQFQ